MNDHVWDILPYDKPQDAPCRQMGLVSWPKCPECNVKLVTFDIDPDGPTNLLGDGRDDAALA